MSTPNPALAAQLLKLQKDAAATTQLVPLEKFQQYTSHRIAMRLVTTTGIMIKFVNYELLTQDPQVIAYLDNELALGRTVGIVKGALLSLEDRDPEAAMERRLRVSIEADIKAQIEAGTYGKDRDFGNTAGASAIGAATSKDTAA